MIKRCPYCRRMIWFSKMNCPYCSSKLGIHRKRGPHYHAIYFVMSAVLGVPIGGALGLAIDTFALFNSARRIAVILGSVLGVLLFYTFFLLHDQKE